MLGVCLRKLCPQDSVGYAFREKKTIRKSTPGGCKTCPRGENGLREASTSLLCQLGGSEGALGTLLALLEPPGLGVSWGSFWDLPGADLDDLDDLWRSVKYNKTLVFFKWLLAPRASRRGPKSLQNRPGKPLGRLLEPKIGLEGPS